MSTNIEIVQSLAYILQIVVILVILGVMFMLYNIMEKSKYNGQAYHSNHSKIIWKSKKCSWQYVMLNWGIRWSDQWQIFPFRNLSDNCCRSIMVGFWKLYVTISYVRAESFNQNRKLFLRKRLWKFYQLVY